MPRRKENSVLDDIFQLFTLGPVWLPFVIAAAAYFIVLKTSLHPLALFIGGFSAFMGLRAAINKHTRRKLLDTQNSIQSIQMLTWQQFELLVGEAYRRKGYVVTETGGGGPDGGVDLRLKRDSETVLVQCKQWRVRTVGVNIARETYGILMSEHATRAIIVTGGEFTADARAFANDKPLELVNGPALLALVQGVQPHAPAVPTQTMPDCPKCAQPMMLRTRRSGTSAGNQFWGCSQYPRCRGTRPYSQEI